MALDSGEKTLEGRVPVGEKGFVDCRSTVVFRMADPTKVVGILKDGVCSLPVKVKRDAVDSAARDYEVGALTIFSVAPLVTAHLAYGQKGLRLKSVDLHNQPPIPLREDHLPLISVEVQDGSKIIKLAVSVKTEVGVVLSRAEPFATLPAYPVCEANSPPSVFSAITVPKNLVRAKPHHKGEEIVNSVACQAGIIS